MATEHELRQLLENISTQIAFLRQSDGDIGNALDEVVNRLNELKTKLPQDVLGESPGYWANQPAETQDELYQRLLSIAKTLEAMVTRVREPTPNDMKWLLRYACGMPVILLFPIFLCICEGALPINIAAKHAESSSQEPPRPPADIPPPSSEVASPNADADSVSAEHSLRIHPAWMLLLILCLGAFGGSLRVISSVVVYIGTRRIYRSWLTYYYFAPLEGALLAVIVCLLALGGIVVPENPGSQEVVDGTIRESIFIHSSTLLYFYALAGFSGLFAKNVMRKLRDACEVLFSSPSTSDPAA